MGCGSSISAAPSHVSSTTDSNAADGSSSTAARPKPDQQPAAPQGGAPATGEKRQSSAEPTQDILPPAAPTSRTLEIAPVAGSSPDRDRSHSPQAIVSPAFAESVALSSPVVEVHREPSGHHSSSDRPFDSHSDSEFEGQFDRSSDHLDRSANSAASPQNLVAEPKKTRMRSKSTMVLQKISLSRQKESQDKPLEDVVLVSTVPPTHDPLSESCKREDTMERSTKVARTRRLSSIYNEFATTVETFLKTNEESENSGNGSESDDEGVKKEKDESTLRRIFNLLDQKNTGTVSQDSLIEGFRRMGHTKTLTTLETYFACADTNHDGMLDWEEFSRFFRSLATLDFVSADDADIDTLPPQPKPRARNYSTILVSMKAYRCDALPSQGGRIKCVALSQNRGLYATSHRNDKNVHVYDYFGTELRVLSGHKDSLLGIAFSNDRKVVASVSRDCSLILWDCTVGHSLNSIQHPGIVTAVAFSCDGKQIYTGCQDNLIRRFSGTKCHLKAVLDRLPRAELGVTVALACQHHANREIVFSRSCDRGAIVADASTLKITTVLEGHKSMVWQAHFRADGTKLLTSCEKYVKVWAASNYSPLFVLDSESFVTEKGIARNLKPKLWTTASFCPPHYGPMIVVFNTDTNMMFVDSDTGKLILSHNFRSSVYAAAVSLDSSAIICGDDWGNMYKFTLL